MKTVLISADGHVPATLRGIVERGSTALVEYLADELSGTPQPEADRFVFWGEGDQPALRTLAESYLRDATAEIRDGIIYVSGTAEASRPAIGLEQLFTWPRDEDRLKLAFLTGA